jgi:hypothetical protein
MILVVLLVLVAAAVAGAGLWLLADAFLEYTDELGEMLPLFACVALVGVLGAIALLFHHLG